jgi:hypothetical protein
VAILVLPYFVVMSLNTADVSSNADEVIDAGTSGMSVLGCIEQSGLDLDTNADDGTEQDTPSKAPTFGDATIDGRWEAFLDAYIVQHVAMQPAASLLDVITAIPVPPPDHALCS